MNTKFRGFRLPKDFLIGTGNAAFQSEGAADRDGKSESIMDFYAKEIAGKPTGSTGKEKTGFSYPLLYPEDLPDRGCFFYDKYEEYIEDMKATGQNVYRMSLAWPRIIPTGDGEVNQKGIDFYNKVINKLIECGITPFVDIYHWDMPMCLMERGGFLSPDFPKWYEKYARVCFEAFGDRVKLWSTFNETQISLGTGYERGKFPPFHKDLKEAILGGHHVMLAHFAAVRACRELVPDARIGLVNAINPSTPAETNDQDLLAATLSIGKYFDWWTCAAANGYYPPIVLRECEKIRAVMPEHYQEDLDKAYAPMDFIGVNYYSTGRVSYSPEAVNHATICESFYSEPGQSFASYPAGIFDVFQYINDAYPGLDIYVTENGCATENTYDKEKECDDPVRIEYLREHLRMVARAIRCGFPVKGYMYWNDADSYEELNGYRLLFGLTWVDHKTGEKAWRKSRYYFSEICKSHMIN